MNEHLNVAHDPRTSYAFDPLTIGRNERLIGSILVAAGKLDAADIDMVLQEADQSNVKFGEAALKLRLISTEDLRLALAGQYAFPYLNPRDASQAQRLPAAFDPQAPFAESLRSIRSRVIEDWSSEGDRARQIAVVSVDRSDGRSFLAANLAAVFSQMGQRTLIIDADLRHPSQHQIFGANPGLGLSGILSDRAGLEQIIHFVGIDNLSLLQAGPLAPNPQELLTRPAFKQLLVQLDAMYDVVIIDTPAAVASSDAQLIARRTGAALLVARAHHTAQGPLGQLARYLSQAHVRVASIINRI